MRAGVATNMVLLLVMASIVSYPALRPARGGCDSVQGPLGFQVPAGAAAARGEKPEQAAIGASERLP